MSIETVVDLYGLKYLIPYNLTTRKPYCVLRVVGEVSFENEIEAVELLGGHSNAPWDVEYGQPSPTITGTVREYPAELFSILETSTITENSAEASGSIGTITNHQGTSIYKNGGITSVTVNPSYLSNLKFGEYVFVATGAQTLSLYIKGLEDDLLDIECLVASGISTTTTGSVQITASGITLTVTGLPAYTIGDTMAFNVRPANTGSTEVLVGTGTEPTSFGLICVFPRKTNGALHWIDIFNVSGRGMPWKGVSREFSEFSINWKPTVRVSDGAVYKWIRVLGV